MGSLLKNMGLRVCIAAGRVVPPKPRLPVLAYHSIDESGSYMSTPVEMFREQMQRLAELGFKCVSMRELYEISALESVPQRTIVLTFDDGLVNFGEVAWPVLADLSFSATVFVPTQYVGGKAFWYEKHQLPLIPCLSWQALRELIGAGADVQSHGVAHKDLATLQDAELRFELEGSKASLEDGLGRPVDHFAYPFGSSTPRVQRACAEAGYKTAVVLGKGRWRPGEDPHAIPRDCLDRISIQGSATARLSIEACALGTFGWYVESKAAFRSLYSRPPHLRRSEQT